MTTKRDDDGWMSDGGSWVGRLRALLDEHERNQNDEENMDSTMTIPTQSLHESSSGPLKNGIRFWKMAGVVLAALTGAGVVAGVVGKAFWVTREEYTEKVRQDSVQNASFQYTLNQVNDTMREQKASFDKVSEQLNGVKTDIAVIKASTNSYRRERE